MKSPELITITGSNAVAVELTSEGRTRRDALLAIAKNHQTIVNAERAEMVAEALRTVKSFTRSVEDSRKDVKAPVLEIGKRIDYLASELTAELEVEAKRLSAILGSWQAEQRKKEEEAKRQAWEEEQRIKAEAARKIAEAEANSRTAASFEKKAAKIEEQAVTAIVQTRAEAAASFIPKPSGIATRENVVFEVDDIGALYAHAPMLCTVSPNNAAIRAYLKSNPNAQLPGVRHWKEAAAIVR